MIYSTSCIPITSFDHTHICATHIFVRFYAVMAKFVLVIALLKERNVWKLEKEKLRRAKEKRD